MTPIVDSKGDALSCKFKEVWPPPQIGIFGNTAEECREEVEEPVYLRLKTWESVCGLTAMEEKKCLSCPNLELNGKGAPVGTGIKLFQDNTSRYRASKK
jgi:hypothetical protein